MPPRFLVRGGRPLRGPIRPAGNKNAALPILAATVLADGPVDLDNIPRIRDVETMLALLVDLGAHGRVDRAESRCASTRARCGPSRSIPSSAPRSAPRSCWPGRCWPASARVTLPPPGGDVIGRRRVDTHFLALEQLGASVTVGDRYELEAKKGSSVPTSSSTSRASPAPRTR